MIDRVSSSPKRTSPMLVLALTIILGAALTVSAQSEKSSSSHGLAGTWRVQVSVQNCATHVPLGPPFQSILSFHSGGTMGGTTSNPAFAAGQRSSDHGVWSHTGGQTYEAASEAYLLFTGGPFVAGTQRIEQVITLNGDEFTSTAAVRFFDTDHQQVLASCAVANALRFE